MLIRTFDLQTIVEALGDTPDSIPFPSTGFYDSCLSSSQVPAKLYLAHAICMSPTYRQRYSQVLSLPLGSVWPWRFCRSSEKKVSARLLSTLLSAIFFPLSTFPISVKPSYRKCDLSMVYDHHKYPFLTILWLPDLRQEEKHVLDKASTWSLSPCHHPQGFSSTVILRSLL